MSATYLRMTTSLRESWRERRKDYERQMQDTYRTSDQDGTRPVAAELRVGDVASSLLLSDGVDYDLLGRGQVRTSSTASDALGQTLLGGGDSERRSGEQDLEEESSAEHDDEGQMDRVTSLEWVF